ncbi:hypothetical protein POTOM_061909 [Populus tomentosa]|uniref:Uncharacterized protein n=1 Tax=Populus tomentosa TaxID=118781 RepID=A0A8X8BY37_POPTO|nr:hypothetical protein POTOM_061909 [Populus tomentosa]
MIIISRCGNELYETVSTDRFIKAYGFSFLISKTICVIRSNSICLVYFHCSLKKFTNKWNWRLDWQEEMYSAMSSVFSRRQSFRVVGVLGKSSVNS